MGGGSGTMDTFGVLRHIATVIRTTTLGDVTLLVKSTANYEYPPSPAVRILHLFWGNLQIPPTHDSWPLDFERQAARKNTNHPFY